MNDEFRSDLKAHVVTDDDGKVRQPQGGKGGRDCRKPARDLLNCLDTPARRSGTST
jgi:hypothetical protein